MRYCPIRPLFVALSLLALSKGQNCAANVIQDENALPGTSSWQLTNPAVLREIEGYASLTSVNKGGQSSFFVRSADAKCTIEVFPMTGAASTGWRKVHDAVRGA